MKYALFMILFCVSGYAQEAYVVPLSPSDAAHAKATYERLQRAQKDWDDEQKVISRKHLIVEPSDPDASSQHYEDSSISGKNLASTSPYWISLGGKPKPEPTEEELAQRAKEGNNLLDSSSPQSQDHSAGTDAAPARCGGAR